MQKIVVDIQAGTVTQLSLSAAEIAALPPPPTPAEIEAEQSTAAKRSLERIDLASIRLIREYIAAKADAPVALKDLETAATVERVKVKV